MIIKLFTPRDIERLHDDERRQRMLSTGIGLICFGILLVTLLMLMGCSTTSPGFGPAALQASVTLGTEFAVERHPEIVPQMRVAAVAVCSVAGGTNISPGEIVAVMDKAGITNQIARDVLNGSLAIYSVVWTEYGMNLEKFQPYTKALCEGLRFGLPPEAGAPPHPMAKKPAPHLK